MPPMPPSSRCRGAHEIISSTRTIISAASDADKTLLPGKKVPYLQLDTIEGLTWSTDDHLNKKNSMIIFYRGLHCPVCSIFLKQVDNQLLDYKKSKRK